MEQVPRRTGSPSGVRANRTDLVEVQMKRDYRSAYEARLAEILREPRRAEVWRPPREDFTFLAGASR